MLEYIREVFRHCREGGATAVEYALMVAAIAAVVGVAAFALGRTSSTSLNKTCSSIASASNSTCS
jgi:Flp pilus assembly pilin Flp